MFFFHTVTYHRVHQRTHSSLHRKTSLNQMWTSTFRISALCVTVSTPPQAGYIVGCLWIVLPTMMQILLCLYHQRMKWLSNRISPILTPWLRVFKIVWKENEDTLNIFQWEVLSYPPLPVWKLRSYFIRSAKLHPSWHCNIFLWEAISYPPVLALKYIFMRNVKISPPPPFLVDFKASKIL